MFNITATFDEWVDIVTTKPLLFKQIAESEGWSYDKIILYLSLDMNDIKKKLDTIHNCIEHRIYLDRCDECIKLDRECKLNTNGICSICGEVIEDV